MNTNFLEDTIAAIATPAGEGGIAVVRVSGKDSFKRVQQIFRSKEKVETMNPWRAIFGKIIDGDREVDEVVLIKYQNPKSYTMENMVEINCHGGIYVTRRILELLVKNGCRIARPGEFTLRAFLNGRIDLAQAEAVVEIIKSQTEFSLQTSIGQLHGKLSKRINEIRNLLIDSCSLLELELDFSEEDVDFVGRENFLNKIEKIVKELKGLISTYKAGRIAREGIKLVIAGKPNVGKSSLLNALIEEERAIVTDTPGTTRDPLEVRLDLQGILFRVFDTAGIKQSDDSIEREGIVRAKSHLQTADIVLHLFDGSAPLDEEDREIMKQLAELKNKKIVRVINKADLKGIIDYKSIIAKNIEVLSISALKNTGVVELEKHIVDLVIDNKKSISNEIIISNARHLDSLERALGGLEKAEVELRKKMSSEFVAIYLRESLDALGEIVGAVTSEEILNNIFDQFCIGK